MSFRGEAAQETSEQVSPVVVKPSAELELVQPNSAVVPAASQTPQALGTKEAYASGNQPDARDVECVAKVIIHEAGNQSYRGKLAVAQVIRNRLNDPRFPKTACAVVKQRGQFFNVDAYSPSRADPVWSEVLEIAEKTLRGHGDEVAPGALFFHSAGANFPGRMKIAKIEDHIFYK